MRSSCLKRISIHWPRSLRSFRHPLIIPSSSGPPYFSSNFSRRSVVCSILGMSRRATASLLPLTFSMMVRIFGYTLKCPRER